MIPTIIHQTAKSKNVSFEERMLQARAKRLLPDWRVYLWDDEDNDQLVRKFFPHWHVAYKSLQRGVAMADIARLTYMHAYGGMYIDTDYKLLRPIGEDLLTRKCILPISRDDDIDSAAFRVCNSVLFSEPGYPLWSDFIDHIFERSNLESIAESDVETVTGPEGLTAFYKLNRQKYPEVYLPTRGMFHPPITHRGLSYDKSTEPYGAHLCWGSWRSKGVVRATKTVIVRKLSWL